MYGKQNENNPEDRIKILQQTYISCQILYLILYIYYETNRVEQDELYTSVSTLENFPHCDNVKKIKTTEMYRLRVGNWRVIFTELLEIVTIEEVKKRNERTYK